MYRTAVILCLAMAVSGMPGCEQKATKGTKELTENERRQLMQQLERQLDRTLRKGEAERARKVATTMLRHEKANSPAENAVAAYGMAASYALRATADEDASEEAKTEAAANREQCFTWLEKAVNEYGFKSADQIDHSYLFDKVRDDPRFRKLSARVNQQEKEYLAKLDEQYRTAVTAIIQSTTQWKLPDDRNIAACGPEEGAVARPAPATARESEVRIATTGAAATQTFADVRAGKPTLVAVLMSDHDGAMKAMEGLNRINEAYADKLRVFGIFNEGTTSEGRIKHVHAYATSPDCDAKFDYGIMTRDEIKSFFGLSINVIPSYILIDAKGDIRFAESGLKEPAELEILVQELLEVNGGTEG